MTLADLLPRLEDVRQRGNRWAGRCPAHPDKSPSLAIAEGDKGLLLKCWAGCSLQSICDALGIEVKDLFYESRPNLVAIRTARVRQERKAQHDEVDGFTLDALREADYFIRSRQRLDISIWTNERLSNELDTLADAHALLWTEELAQWT